MIFFGSISIQNVSGGKVQFGNIVNISPTSPETSTGAGSENEGMQIMTYTGYSLSGSMGQRDGSPS